MGQRTALFVGAVLLVSALIGASAPARANVYTVVGNGDLSIFSATITTSDTGNASHPGGYDIVGITGFITGFGAIAGVIPASATSVPIGGDVDIIAPTDNIFYPASPYFDDLGLGFYFAPADQTPDKLGGGIWFALGQINLFIGEWKFDGHGTVTVAEVAATPLPATLPLFLTGAGVLSLLGWRRKRKPTA